MSTMIHYKGIEHERTQDAPFIGALILANDCHKNCPGCFNQYLRKQQTWEASVRDILLEVKENAFNEGIILGGLEWTEQPRELVALTLEALRVDLKVCIYTHLSQEQFRTMFPALAMKDILLKCGDYREGLSGYTLDNIGVTLASSNQYMVNLKDIR